ncbi:SLC13 family permease [Pseudoflavonifractor sp. MSJ-37]|uniref:SLC13 family permease n=1 Tax=Pseudoflavonifractor sp. MSJ-37 TaxID=2841531 RepID=UPI001C0F868A|nr:SLC13 family permease [Pseudoflavonifractor sp. MSJ-37]MBU5434636.1 anion permease [Pseudoflavonifractor sp. MSJ-37]
MREKILRWVREEPVLFASAVCAVGSMALTPPSAAYLGYLDGRVLILLFSLMAVVAGFQDCGLFEVLAQRMLSGRHPVRVLELTLVLLPFFASMLITNDVALIAFVPFAVVVLERLDRRGRLIPVVVLQTLAANLGSMATPVGNPQNLLLYGRFHLSLGDFFSVVGPAAAVSGIALTLVCLTGERESVQVDFPERAVLRKPRRMVLLTVLFLLCLLCVFRVIPAPVLLAVVLGSLLLFGRDLLPQVDYGLLMTFVCFFVFAGNIGGSPPVRGLLTAVLSRNTALITGLASQVISNVPAALLLSGFTEDWRGLLLGADIGGLGTPVASLASLISMRLCLKAGAEPGKYLRTFLLANAAGLVLLSAVAWLWRLAG